MPLKPDRLGLLAFVAVMAMATLGSGLQDSGEGAPGSQRRPAVEGRQDPVARAREFTIAVGEKKDSSGTAFYLGGGQWLTARHVVDGCDRTGILIGPERAQPATSVVVHPNADVALMQIDRAADPVGFAAQPPATGDDAFHIGYPRGVPGSLHSRLLGARVMRVTGRYRTREPVLAWAEIQRIPDDDRPLSGLSGGPVFDRAGRLVGIHVAGSVRRGRSYTATLDSIDQLLAAEGVEKPGSRVVEAISPDNLRDVARNLRADLTVAKALCDVQ